MEQRISSGSSRERLIVYVDGFNLYHGLHDEFGRKYLWLDLVKLARSLRPKQSLVSVRYFTASVMNDPGAQARQDHYLDALQRLHPNDIEIVKGRYQAKVRKCFNCGHQYTQYEEKETDVNIATRIVLDASQGAFDSALIISGDSDVAPAVRIVKQLNTELFIAAAFPPSRYSAELKKLMPASFHIGKAKIRQAQLHSEFSADGRSFRRPEKWH